MRLFKKSFLFIACISGQIFLHAQDPKLVVEKPGTFKITADKLNGLGPDEYGKAFNFTDEESKAAVKNLTALIGVFRKTPVLNDIKGFDGIGHLNISTSNTKFGYGVPCMVYLFFETWSLIKGTEVKFTIEPPQFRFDVNRTTVFSNNGFEESSYSIAYNPTNPAFNAIGINKATVEMNELFYLPGVKTEESPGIDRYGDNLIIFNPDRPAYWEQVTIREVFRLLIEYWKLVPDKIQVEAMIPILENEFSNFSETEKDGFAYFGNHESISRISSANNETPVMRPNPDYWNRKLPRSAIQFMVMEIPPKEVVKSKMGERWERQDGYYYVSRMLYELDINSLVPCIEK